MLSLLNLLTEENEATALPLLVEVFSKTLLKKANKTNHQMIIFHQKVKLVTNKVQVINIIIN